MTNGARLRLAPGGKEKGCGLFRGKNFLNGEPWVFLKILMVPHGAGGAGKKIGFAHGRPRKKTGRSPNYLSLCVGVPEKTGLQK